MPDTAPPLAVEGISKGFPGVQALRDVSFDCRAGEIHALVGENGAGKSTLMRILTGVYQPDAGRIRVRGELAVIASPVDAFRQGIAMVYQDTRLIPDLDAARNIFLGHEPGGLLIDVGAMRRAAAGLLARLGEDVDLGRPVRELSVATRQIVEIARALSAEARVLILDEPTSSLTPNEVAAVCAILRDLRARGTAVVFISHRLPEVFAIADRITVLKDGEIVGTVATAATTTGAIVRMMVGRDLALAFPPRSKRFGPVVLDVAHFDAPGHFRDVSFTVRAGEVVGLGGIKGSGQDAIVRALFGLVPARGTARVDGKLLAVRSPADAIAAGIVYVPADRRGEGMFLPHSLRENISLPHLAEMSRLGLVSLDKERAAARGQIAALDIRTPSDRQPVGLLSGGNQQKVAIARWMLADPRVMLFDEPTLGVDVGAKMEIYRLIRRLADGGAAVVVVSSDVIELIGLSDRILVAADGRLVDEVPPEEASEERIVGSAVRHQRAAQADEAGAMPAKPTAERRSAWQPFFRRYGAVLLLTAILVAVVAYTSSQSPYFLTPRNFANLAVQVAPLVIVALGQMTVILIGGIDLSVGPTMSLVTAIASYLLVADPPAGFALGVAACLLAGLAVGTLNGLLVRVFRLPDLIATLATYSIVLGAALTLRPAPGGSVSGDFADGVLARIGSVPVVFVIAALAVVAAEILLLRSRIGARLYATGSSEDGAFVAGIPVGRVRAGAYLFCGLTAAVAGIIIACRIGGGDPQAGANFTLLSITAVILGGTSVFGGRGTALGTFAGACLVMLLQNALNQLHISSYWQYLWTGLLTLAAVTLYSLRGGSRLPRWLRPRRGPQAEPAGGGSHG